MATTTTTDVRCLNKAAVAALAPMHECVLSSCRRVSQMRHAFTLTVLCLLADLGDSYPDDILCYRNWYFDSPRPAPRRCPPSDLFSYFECCGESDGCCRRIRVELLIFIFVPLSVLVAVLFCCTIISLVRKPRERVVHDGPRMSRDERECHYF